MYVCIILAVLLLSFLKTNLNEFYHLWLLYIFNKILKTEFYVRSGKWHILYVPIKSVNIVCVI